MKNNFFEKLKGIKIRIVSKGNFYHGKILNSTDETLFFRDKKEKILAFKFSEIKEIKILKEDFA